MWILSICTVQSYGPVSTVGDVLVNSLLDTQCEQCARWRALWRNLCNKTGLRHICVGCCPRMPTHLVRDRVTMGFSRGDRFLVVSDQLARAREFWLLGLDLPVTNKKDKGCKSSRVWCWLSDSVCSAIFAPDNFIDPCAELAKKLPQRIRVRLC